MKYIFLYFFFVCLDSPDIVRPDVYCAYKKTLSKQFIGATSNSYGFSKCNIFEKYKDFLIYCISLYSDVREYSLKFPVWYNLI